MRNLTTLLAVAAVFGAAAQTTGSLSLRDHSVYCPSANDNVMQVSYDNLINVSNAKATITIGTVVSPLEVTDVTEYGFTLPVGSALANKVNNTQFTINVTGVLPADTINTEVEDLNGDYLYRTTLPTVTSNPKEGELQNAVQDIRFSFTETVNVEQILFMSGTFMARKVNSVEGAAGYARAINASILEDYWSKTENPARMEILLSGVTINGGWYLPEYTFNYTHQFPVETASYKTYSPLNSEATVWDVYGDGWGFVDVVFSGEVDYENASASIVYTRTTGSSISDSVSGSEMWGDWSWWDNLYHLEIPLPAADLTESTLKSISIKVSGIKSNNTVVTVPEIVYNNTILPTSIEKAKNATTGINLQIQEGDMLNVYNLQGAIVMENSSAVELTNLPKGIYIINGKKIAVK